MQIAVEQAGSATILYSDSALRLHGEGGEEVCVALSCLIPESHGLMFHLLHLKSATCVYMRVFIFVFF